MATKVVFNIERYVSGKEKAFTDKEIEEVEDTYDSLLEEFID